MIFGMNQFELLLGIVPYLSSIVFIGATVCCAIFLFLIYKTLLRIERSRKHVEEQPPNPGTAPIDMTGFNHEQNQIDR